MSHLSPAFSRLIAPVDVDRFFGTYWEQQTLFLRREERGYYDDILTVDDIDGYFQSQHLSPHFVAVAHREGRCQIYENRPANCRKYRCELLKKYESGAVSWHDAQQRIGRVRMLKETLGTELARVVPNAGGLSVAAVWTRVPTQQELAADRELLKRWAPVMLRVAALLDALQRHFRPPRQTRDRSGSSSQTSREFNS
jgi:Fe-S-cluster containining protein